MTLQARVENIADSLGHLRLGVERMNARLGEDIRANQKRIDGLNGAVDALEEEASALRAWQEGHAFICPFAGVDAATANIAALYHLIERHFSADELGETMLDLGVPEANISGNSHIARVQSLVNYMRRQRRLQELLNYCQQKRPRVTWPLFVGET